MNAKFQTIVEGVTPKKIETGLKALNKAYEDRGAMERAKNPDNDKIHASLKASHTVLGTKNAVAVLIAAEAAPDFIKQSTREGSAYNVYAGNKLADLVQALETGVIKNQINNAIMRSLFQFRAAKETFTGEMARAAASDKIRVQGQIGKLLVRHTVSASTAPTQASSTLQALQTLGVVKRSGARNAMSYELTDTPATKRFEEIVKKAA